MMKISEKQYESQEVERESEIKLYLSSLVIMTRNLSPYSIISSKNWTNLQSLRCYSIIRGDNKNNSSHPSPGTVVTVPPNNSFCGVMSHNKPWRVLCC